MYRTLFTQTSNKSATNKQNKHNKHNKNHRQSKTQIANIHSKLELLLLALLLVPALHLV